jgi:PAS domain S-box-containing protein
MNSSLSLAFGPRQLRRATWLFFTLWTLAVATSVLWNVRLLHDAMFDAAVTDARSHFNKDVLYLTNPANMTRQVHELKAQEDGVLGHITSLKPLRPENAPDAWEAAALRAFEQGRTEVSSRELLHGEPRLRLMKPLVTEAVCLKCHAAQGYREGDIRGGISVAVPLDPYLALAQARIGHIAGAHAGLWILGALGLFLGERQMRQRLDKQLQAELEIQHQATFPRFNPNPVLEFSAAGEINYFNDATGEMARAVGRENPAQILPPNTAAMVRECLATGKPKLRVETQIGPRVISWSYFPIKFNNTVHCYAGDVTARKQAEEKVQQLSRAVEQNPALIVITNPAGDIEYANPKFIEITGYTLAEVLGKNPRVLKSGDKGPEAYRQLWLTITSGKEWRGEFHNKKKNGELYWESASISPIRDLAGRVTHYVAVKEDITARKQAEAERDQLVQDLQNALANVKSLSGLLPICAGCKKIRDDKGYWSQVESYIQKHSEATFTHGMCPDCVKKWYPGLKVATPDNPTPPTP